MRRSPAQPDMPVYELKGELARLSVRPDARDAEIKLAWVNSICFAVLLIGVIGARRGTVAIKPVPPIEQLIPAVLEPWPQPPEPPAARTETPEPQESASPATVVVTLPSPQIAFDVPSIGTLLVPAKLAVAPPPKPLAPVVQRQAGIVESTGSAGQRPQPPYPRTALMEGQQGVVRLKLTGDNAGRVLAAEVIASSGHAVLDRSTAEFIKHHWRLPAGAGGQVFEASVIYQLQRN